VKTTMIEIPAELKPAMENVCKILHSFEHAAQAGRAVDYGAVERAMREALNDLEVASHRMMLVQLDVPWRDIIVGEKRYRRIGRHPDVYFTSAGEVRIERNVFRELGVHNGPTVDAISLRAGVVGDGWLPGAARQMAHLIQRGTSREAETTAQERGRLPYSRSSFERVGHAVGELLVQSAADIEEALIADFNVPPKARGLSVSLDRASVPMEEPTKRKPGRPRQGAAKRPVQRAYRMAYCGTVALVDDKGNAIHVIRYGRMPGGDAHALAESLAGDVHALLAKRPELAITLNCDGAPELWNLLRTELNEAKLGQPVAELIDIYPLLEKLHAAALRIHGEAGAGAVVQRWKMRLLNTDGAARRIGRELANGPHSRAEEVRQAITYIENNHDRMHYASARAEGRPVGSGVIEATCKSLLSMRMKRPGARWKEHTGEHVVQLRALALSDRWAPAINLTLAPLRKAVRRAA
jgi:hypothetical protein